MARRDDGALEVDRLVLGERAARAFKAENRFGRKGSTRMRRVAIVHRFNHEPDCGTPCRCGGRDT